MQIKNTKTKTNKKPSAAVTEEVHTPVLLQSVLAYLDPRPGESYLDLTAGYGGHAEMVLSSTLTAPAVLVDRDINSINYLVEKFDQKVVAIRHQDFLSASRELVENGSKFDLILADLGVSSPHLNNASRGFSLMQPGPLDMRMDQSQKLRAGDIINGYSETALSDIFWEYGEETASHKIAKMIIRSRPINTTTQLAELVSSIKPQGRTKIHPATKVFQALRIAVNSELSQLEQALPLWLELLNPGGRLVVISFHSLEDRIVKRFFKDEASDGYDAVFRVLTKQPVVATGEEIVHNPRSRSAKLRAVAKIKTTGG